MESLDCPDGSQFTPVRSESVTSLQALTMLHDRFIVRQSEYTAARLAAAATGLGRSDPPVVQAGPAARPVAGGEPALGSLRGAARTGECLPDDVEHERICLRQLKTCLSGAQTCRLPGEIFA